MSASTGHHFAGPTNRFWRLLYESGIVPEPVMHEDDVRLPEWGIGMTNLVARPSPGIDALKPAEYIEGWTILEQKIAKYRPEIVAFVGVTMYRVLRKVIAGQAVAAPKATGAGGLEIHPGFQEATVHGARMFVLPNPSGRNANFSYAEMLDAFRALRRAMRRLSSSVSARQRPARRLNGDAASRKSAGAGPGRLPRVAGTPARTTPSRPAVAPSRKATRTRGRSQS